MRKHRAERSELPKKKKAASAEGEKQVTYHREITLPVDGNLRPSASAHKLQKAFPEIVHKIQKAFPEKPPGSIRIRLFAGQESIAPPAPPRSSETRINELEKKLEILGEELKNLRKQMKEPRSGVEFSPAPYRIAPRNSLARP